jgi:hypothetical protein
MFAFNFLQEYVDRGVYAKISSGVHPIFCPFINIGPLQGVKQLELEPDY